LRGLWFLTLEIKYAIKCAAAPCYCGAGRATIDRYLLPTGPTAANPPHATANGTDRRTDTVALHIDRAPHAIRAVPANLNIGVSTCRT